MRKLSLLTLMVLFSFLILSACNLPLTTATPPVVSDDEMATRVAEILTEAPQPTQGLPTAELPPLDTPVPSATMPEMTATNEPVADTPVPTQPPTEVPTTAPTATQIPPTDIPPTATIAATAAPAFTPPANDPRAKLGGATWTDSMDNDKAWPTGPDQYTAIAFSDGKLKLTGLTTTDGWRLASTGKLADVYIEAAISTGTCTGSDRYGLIFRIPVANEANKGYLFAISCDGKFNLRKWDATLGANGTMETLVNWTKSDAIQAGSNKTNNIGVMTVNDRIYLYINGVLVKEIQDDTFKEGSFGLFIGAKETANFNILVDEISYWLNPKP